MVTLETPRTFASSTCWRPRRSRKFRSQLAKSLGGTREVVDILGPGEGLPDPLAEGLEQAADHPLLGGGVLALKVQDGVGADAGRCGQGGRGEAQLAPEVPNSLSYRGACELRGGKAVYIQGLLETDKSYPFRPAWGALSPVVVSRSRSPVCQGFRPLSMWGHTQVEPTRIP